MNDIPQPKDLLDFRVAANWARLFWRFAKAKKWIPITSTCVMTVLAIGALFVLPRTYHTETQLLAKRNQYLMPKDDRPWDVLTESASEILHRRENLIQMVRQTNLVHEWKARRPPILKLKDEIREALLGPVDDEAMVEVLVNLLDLKLMVESEKDTITIVVEWNDPEMAFRLAAAAQRAFLEERHVQEVSLLAESMAILEGHAAKYEPDIEKQIKAIHELVEEKQTEARDERTAKIEKTKASEPKPIYVKPEPQKAGPSPDDLARISELRVLVDSKTRTLKSLTAASDQRVAELTAKLADLRAVYTEAHPVITDLEQQIQVAQIPSPQVARLERELSPLEDELDTLLAKTGEPSSAGARRGGRIANLGARVLRELDDEIQISRDDPDLSFARSELSAKIRDFQRLRSEQNQAALDLSTAEAAFKHRYRVITPPEVPDKPIKPNPLAVIIGGIFGGLFFGLTLAIVLALRRGVIYEAWQVEHSLALPTLAKVDLLAHGDPPSA